MNDIKVEIGIPIPKSGKRSKYPWRNMGVGDSFLIPKITISMGAVNERYAPMKFIMRKAEGGYRVWRTE
ncbi:MAG: hypothetical protein OEL79_04715 [Chromatiales bacterium]|nr:hypothetical protein [Chromatiales bacterium]